MMVIYQRLSYRKICRKFYKRKFIHRPSQTATPNDINTWVNLVEGQIQKVYLNEKGYVGVIYNKAGYKNAFALLFIAVSV